MRQVCLVAALMAGVAGTTAAQLAVQQPTEKLLVLPFMVASADSATSIALSDAVRERIGQLAKYKVLVITKAKLCEALQASGFPCDGLLDDQQAKQLARFLNVQAYVTGTLAHNGSTVVANVRVYDISSSGMAATYTASNNPGTTQALAETIAQRLNTIIRASEQSRECTASRQRGQFARAIAAAQKALTIDSTSTGAYLCIASVYEAQRMPVESLIAASERALKGDPHNGTALENIAHGWQQKGDTLKAIDAFIRRWEGDKRNTSELLGIVQLLRQMKEFKRAVDLLDAGLQVAPADQAMLELKTRSCIEGSLWPCAVAGLKAQAQHDSALLKDTTFLNTATRGGAFETAGMVDSAVAIYKKALALEQGNDVPLSLLIAKTIVDHAVYDPHGFVAPRDSAALRPLQQAFGEKVDSARPYLHPGLVSSDSTQRLTAAVIMLTGGSKIAQAAAYDHAYIWLDTLLQAVAPKSASDTVGPRFQVRINASFWYGLSSVLTLNKPYQAMTQLKANDRQRCDKAKAIFDRLERTKTALLLGRRVHPPTADQMLGFVAQYEKGKDQVRQAFKCRNF